MPGEPGAGATGGWSTLLVWGASGGVYPRRPDRRDKPSGPPNWTSALGQLYRSAARNQPTAPARAGGGCGRRWDGPEGHGGERNRAAALASRLLPPPLGQPRRRAWRPLATSP